MFQHRKPRVPLPLIPQSAGLPYAERLFIGLCTRMQVICCVKTIRCCSCVIVTSGNCVECNRQSTHVHVIDSKFTSCLLQSLPPFLEAKHAVRIAEHKNGWAHVGWVCALVVSAFYRSCTTSQSDCSPGTGLSCCCGSFCLHACSYCFLGGHTSVGEQRG